MIELIDLVGLAGVPLVLALVELTKKTLPWLEERWYPLVSIAWAEVLNIALAYMLMSDVRVAVLLGLVAGLAASGLYSGGRALANK